MTALITFIFAPFLLLLRKPPILNEEQVLLQSGCVKYSAIAVATPDEDDDSHSRPVVATKILMQQPSLTSTNPFVHPPTYSKQPGSAPLVHWSANDFLKTEPTKQQFIV